MYHRENIVMISSSSVVTVLDDLLILFFFKSWHAVHTLSVCISLCIKCIMLNDNILEMSQRKKVHSTHSVALVFLLISPFNVWDSKKKKKKVGLQECQTLASLKESRKIYQVRIDWAAPSYLQCRGREVSFPPQRIIDLIGNYFTIFENTVQFNQF